MLFAQTKPASDGEIQIKQLERAWNQAEAKHDVGALKSIVGDTLSYIDFDGSIMNKAEYLEDVTKTSYQADHLYDEGLKVNVYDNAAVAVACIGRRAPTRARPTRTGYGLRIPGSSRSAYGAVWPARIRLSHRGIHVAQAVQAPLLSRSSSFSAWSRTSQYSCELRPRLGAKPRRAIL